MRAVLSLLPLLLSLTAPAPARSQPASQPAEVGEGRLHLLYTADLYGRFAWPGCEKRTPGKADLSHLVAAVEARRTALRTAGEDRPLVVAGGSMLRPDVMGSHIFTSGRAWAGTAIDLLRKVGFQAVSVGPYDFGAHPDALKSYMTRMGKAKIPLLAANVTCSDKNDFRCRHLGWQGRRYLVLQGRDLRVGILAVVREDLPSRILGRSAGSLTAADPVKEAKRLIRQLRGKERVDLVVVLANLNLESDSPQPVIAFARKLGRDAPDLMLADAMFDREGKDFIGQIRSRGGPLIVGTDRFGQHLGEAIVRYSRVGSKVTVKGVEARMHKVADFAPDKRTAQQVVYLLDEVCRSLNRPLGRGRFARPASQDTFARYTMEIMRNRMRAELALLNDSALADTSFPMKGTLTREKVLRAIRTETHLGAFWISGSRVVKLLGPYVTGDKRGLDVLGLTKKGTRWYINSRPLIDGLHYKVAATRFIASGGDGLIALKTERFRDSGFMLRRVVTDFFEDDLQAKRDGDPSIDAAKDFPDPWDQWVLYAGADVGISVSNLTVGNYGPKKGTRYNKPLLLRDDVTSLKFDTALSLGASNRNHALEGDVSLQYGQTWTLTAAEKADGEQDATTAETLDKIRGDFLYRLNKLRNLKGPGLWYVPVPYGEATVITEFTTDSAYCVARCDDSDSSNHETETYRYLELGGTVGVGFLLHPYLFAKAGFAVSGELLTPAAALEQVGDERAARTGIYLGYRLRRLKVVSDARHPLQLESRLDYYATDLTASRRQELTLQTKLYFELTRFLQVSASHSLYVFDTHCTRSSCDKGANDISTANDVSLGLNLLLDYRHQVF
jgi:2',3'-cyclic-nucleotide 2'-phosphodiesterase (5'-nucleotidase family)